MSEQKKDFLEILPVEISDINAFAKEGVLLPEGFDNLYLKRNNSIFIRNHYKTGEVCYDMVMVNNGKKKKVGWIGLNQKDFNIEGKEINNCWARNIKMFNEKNISYGKMGFTRAVVKTLMHEMKRMNIEYVAAEVEQDNVNSLKMGKAIGWKDPVAEYVAHNKKPVYLFFAPVNEIVDFLENKTRQAKKLDKNLLDQKKSGIKDLQQEENENSSKILEMRNRLNKINPKEKPPFKPIDRSKVDFSKMTYVTKNR